MGIRSLLLTKTTNHCFNMKALKVVAMALTICSRVGGLSVLESTTSFEKPSTDPLLTGFTSFEVISSDGILTDDSGPDPYTGTDGNGCGYPPWKGDDLCDDENNNAGCDWDGGDCCDNDNDNWKVYCTECECKDPAFAEAGPWPPCAEVRIDYNGNDLIDPRGYHKYGLPVPQVWTAEACGTICNQSDGCLYWTLVPLNGTCFPKTSKEGKMTALQAISGAKGCV